MNLIMMLTNKTTYLTIKGMLHSKGDPQNGKEASDSAKREHLKIPVQTD